MFRSGWGECVCVNGMGVCMCSLVCVCGGGVGRGVMYKLFFENGRI